MYVYLDAQHCITHWCCCAALGGPSVPAPQRAEAGPARWWRETFALVCIVRLFAIKSSTSRVLSVYCTSVQGQGESVASGSPIVLMFPGAAGPKAEYSGFATNLADAGYTVMVLESLVTVGPNPPLVPVAAALNFPQATATEVALNWFNTQGGSGGGYGDATSLCPTPDTSTVLLAGHSEGARVVRVMHHLWVHTVPTSIWTPALCGPM